jgi:hypothetical protein
LILCWTYSDDRFSSLINLKTFDSNNI